MQSVSAALAAVAESVPFDSSVPLGNEVIYPFAESRCLAESSLANEIFLFSSIVLSIEKGLWHVPLNARRYRPDSPVQDFEPYCKPSRCLSAPRCSSSGRKPPLHLRRRLSIERIDALLNPADHSCRASIRSRTAGQVVALHGLSSVAMFFRAIDTIDMSIVCPATFCVQQSHINAQLHSIRPVTA